jgi:hypothetical protein
LKRRIIRQDTHDPITGYFIFGGFVHRPKQPSGLRAKREDQRDESKLGGVLDVVRWLVLPANYPENFGLPTSGVRTTNRRAALAPTVWEGRGLGFFGLGPVGGLGYDYS